MEQPQRHTSILWPLVLVGLGSIILVTNLGWLKWDTWSPLLQLWPVLLVAGGLELIVGRRSRAMAWAIPILTVSVLAGSIWFMSQGRSIVTSDVVRQPLGTAQQANVQVNLGVGTLQIKGLGRSSNLLEANLERPAGQTIRQTMRMRGDTAMLALSSTGRSVGWPATLSNGRQPTWDMRLHSGVPLEMTIELGAGQANLDLSALRLTHLAFTNGAGQSIVTLPATGQVDATISTGAGQVTIMLPHGMAARIHATAGLGNVQVLGPYEHQNDRYISPNYATAANKVELEVSAGVGSITIREDAGR